MDYYKNSAEKIASGIIRNAFEKYLEQGIDFEFMGVKVFKNADAFTPGKMVDAFSTLDGYTINDLKKLLYMTAGMNIETWGILYYLRGLARLKDKIKLEDNVLTVLKMKLDYRSFVNENQELMYGMPTNYLGCALSIALYREKLGWENENAGQKFLNKILEHTENFSETVYCDDGKGEGRFDRYTFLLPAEISERYIDIGRQVPDEIIRMLKKSCEMALALENKRGAGFNYGRSLGIYGDTAILEILSVGAYLGILDDDLGYAYYYCERIAERIFKTWFDCEQYCFDMWSNGKKGDNYLVANRALGDNLSVSMHLINTYKLWNRVSPHSFTSSATKGKSYFVSFAKKPYERAVAVYRNKGYTFSLPMISGGEGRYLHSAYFPIPQEGNILVCPPSTALPILTPIFESVDREYMAPIVYFKNINVKENNDFLSVKYQMDCMCRIGGQMPMADARGRVKCEYIFEPGMITKKEIYIFDPTLKINCMVMEFDNFSKPIKVTGNKATFPGVGIKSFEVSGMRITNVADVSKDRRYSTPIGNLRSAVQCIKNRFDLNEPIEVSWKITY